MSSQFALTPRQWQVRYGERDNWARWFDVPEATNRKINDAYDQGATEVSLVWAYPEERGTYDNNLSRYLIIFNREKGFSGVQNNPDTKMERAMRCVGIMHDDADEEMMSRCVRIMHDETMVLASSS